jgi:hypothetical protein
MQALASREREIVSKLLTTPGVEIGRKETWIAVEMTVDADISRL